MRLAKTLQAIRTGRYRAHDPRSASLTKLAQALPYKAFAELEPRLQPDGKLKFGEHSLTVDQVLDIEETESF